METDGILSTGAPSLSARRAWIEICHWHLVERTSGQVALRKESVDRNPKQPVYLDFQSVALRKESVDRNIQPANTFPGIVGRSPQGERG